MAGKRYAILIGNNKFPKSEGRLTNLNCPETDVDGMAEILSSEDLGGFTTIIPLKNFSHHAVLKKMGKVFDLARNDDLVLVYYSGHGKQDMEGNLHLATIDTNPVTSNALTSSSIPVEAIRRFIKHSNVQTTVLILDCCYSGAIEGVFVRGGVDEQLRNVSNTRGTYIITASTALQSAVEKERDKYGLLTKHIIKGIRDGLADQDKDGWIHMDELYEYVYKQVTDEGAQEPMRWTLGVKGNELTIARAGKNEQIQARIEALAQAGQSAQAFGDWQTAIEKFSEIQELDPNHQATIWLPQAREQQKLAIWYTEAIKLFDARQWIEALEFFERIITVDGKYRNAPTWIERVKREIRDESVATGLAEATQAIAKEDWDSAITSVIRVLSAAPDNDQARGMLANAKQQKEIQDLYNQGVNHYQSHRWRDAWICFDQIRKRVGVYRDVTSILSDIERIESEEEERLRAQQRIIEQQADRKFSEAKDAIAIQKWDVAAQKLHEVGHLEAKGTFVPDKLKEVHRILMRSQQQQGIDVLYDTGLIHYNAHRWAAAWISFCQIQNKVGKYKNVSTLLREIDNKRARAYILKWYVCFGLVAVSCVAFGLSFIWRSYFVAPPTANALTISGGVLLLIGSYFFVQLSKDSDSFWREIHRLRLSTSVQLENSETASDTTTFAVADWRVAAEAQLSQRLTSLSHIDEVSEIDSTFITTAEYQLFSAEAQIENKYSHLPDHWMESGVQHDISTQPITGITVQDALRFCEWLSKRTEAKMSYRIPTSEEATKFPSSEGAIAAWCTTGATYDLVGLSAPNKTTIRQALTRLTEGSLPMSPSLSKRLIIKASGGQTMKSMGRALASLRLDFDPSELIYDFNAAVSLKFTPALAYASLQNLAKTMDLHGWSIWNTDNVTTLTPSLQALSVNDLSKLRELAESLADSHRPIASGVSRLIIALLDIIAAKTILDKRLAQREYAIRILESAYVGYGSLLSALAQKDSRTKFERWLRPFANIEVQKASVGNDRAQVAEVYWYWRIVMARESNELPAWEGVRIVREKSR